MQIHQVKAIALLLWICIFPELMAQQLQNADSESKNTFSTELRSWYGTVGIGIETDIKPNVHAAFEYFFSPGKQRVYYLGFQLNLMNSLKDFENKHIGRNEVGNHNNVTMTNLGITQKFYLKPVGRVAPYFNVCGGIRFMQQEVYKRYQTTFLGFPIKAQDSIYANEALNFSYAVGTGMFISFADNVGINLGFDVCHWQSFNMYLNETRKPTFAVINLSVQFGFDRRGKRR